MGIEALLAVRPFVSPNFDFFFAFVVQMYYDDYDMKEFGRTRRSCGLLMGRKVLDVIPLFA